MADYQVIQELEKTRNVLQNLHTLLKEVSIPGAKAGQAADGMILIGNMVHQCNQQIKTAKEDLAREVNEEKKATKLEAAASTESTPQAESVPNEAK